MLPTDSLQQFIGPCDYLQWRYTLIVPSSYHYFQCDTMFSHNRTTYKCGKEGKQSLGMTLTLRSLHNCLQVKINYIYTCFKFSFWQTEQCKWVWMQVRSGPLPSKKWLDLYTFSCNFPAVQSIHNAIKKSHSKICKKTRDYAENHSGHANIFTLTCKQTHKDAFFGRCTLAIWVPYHTREKKRNLIWAVATGENVKKLCRYLDSQMLLHRRSN